jgi:hypothetical protein
VASCGCWFSWFSQLILKIPIHHFHGTGENTLHYHLKCHHKVFFARWDL